METMFMNSLPFEPTSENTSGGILPRGVQSQRRGVGGEGPKGKLYIFPDQPYTPNNRPFEPMRPLSSSPSLPNENTPGEILPPTVEPQIGRQEQQGELQKGDYARGKQITKGSRDNPNDVTKEENVEGIYVGPGEEGKKRLVEPPFDNKAWNPTTGKEDTLPDELQPDIVSFPYHDVEPESVQQIPVDDLRKRNAERIKEQLQK